MIAAASPVAAGFLSEPDELLGALLTLVATGVVVALVDWLFRRRGRRLAAAVAGGRLSPVADTRLRLVRRLVVVLIIVVGVALALARFASFTELAATLLTSAAVAAAVVGLAARSTLGNAIAGITLAITQPLRIGDVVTVDERTGTVEDVRLTTTYIRKRDGRRWIVPNEILTGSPILNHTILDPAQRVEVSAWIAQGAEVAQAIAALTEEGQATCRAHGAAEEELEVEVAELASDGVRLELRALATDSNSERILAAALRAAAHDRLKRDGLLDQAA